MLLIKKLILANVLGAGIAVPTVTYTKQGEKTETLELGSTLKRWNQLLNHTSGKNSFEKISKVFSENLTTFSNSAVVNAVKHILMKWATEIWENQEAYFPISQRLNKFFFYYHIHQWQVKKEIEELSWELIKKFFIDFFFKDKGWFLLENFGDFSSFALQEWEKKERPMKVYEWTLKYSNAGENQQVSSSEDSLYDSSVLDSAKNKHSYLFPQIQASEEYSSFISKFTHTKEIDLSYFKKTWTTVSELSTLTDGYKLGSLIHLYTKKDSFNEDENVAQDDVITELKLKKSPSEKLQASENPLYLFLKEDAQNCLTIQNSLFNEKINKQLNVDKEKPTCLYGARWLTPENGDSGSKKTILASREQDRISFYYLTGESGLKNGTENHKSLTQQETEVIEKVTKFVEKNFENLFLKFLFSKSTSKCNHDESLSRPHTTFVFKSTGTVSSKTWDFSEFLGKNLKILCASTDYLDSLYWGQTIQKLQSILLSVYKNIPQEFESQERSTSKGFQLPTKAGLFSPLTYKRNPKNNVQDEEIDFFALREKVQDQNGWFFADIMHFLFNNPEKQKIFSLEEKAHNLRELLLEGKNEKGLFQSDSLDNLFLSESFYRTQLEAIAGDKLKASHTIFVSKSKDILSTAENAEDLKKGNFSSWLSALINSLGQDKSQKEGTTGYPWADLINKSLFLEPLLKSPLEKKIFYGTFGQVSSEGSETDSSNLNNLSIRAKNDWILDHFYLSDSAYESSSEAYQDFLAFLVSIKWMTHNNYSNIAKVINYILSKNENKNAYLIWTKEITEKQKEEIEKGKEEEEQKSEEKLKKVLEAAGFSSDIFNPLLKEGLHLTGSDEGGSSSSAAQSFSADGSVYKVEAFKNGNGAETTTHKTKLSGFAGLVTDSFSTRELPKALKDYLFKEFLKLNSPDNKNYSAEEATAPAAPAPAEAKKFVEGAFFSENQKRKLTKNEEILEILQRVRKKDKLLKYFDETNNSLRNVLGDKAKSLESLTIEDLIQELKGKFNGSHQVANGEGGENSEIKDLYKLFNRFSGYIYSSKGQEKSPYVFSETQEGTEEKKYYIGFVYQINQFDFQKEGITEFTKDLSEDTLHTLISLLASNKEIRDWIYNSEIIKQLSI